ncbi:hypothetical protein GCM10009754_33810 [Amycolatopsis minnesotensis]|uniref:Uncharacterized protein n=1 Tax=Amycolatopsis minnesotensis TaxID=337894 RepID=A0ABN2QYI2_9PSEU
MGDVQSGRTDTLPSWVSGELPSAGSGGWSSRQTTMHKRDLAHCHAGHKQGRWIVY